MQTSQRVDYTPSSDEQRRLTITVRNIRRLAAWRLKKAAHEYAKVHAEWTPATIVLTPKAIVLTQALSP